MRKNRFGKLTKEMKEATKNLKSVEKKQKKVEVDIRATKARIKQLANEVKELSGPVSAAIRRTLRELGIELTIYWAGTFVGPQIDKLRDRSRYTFILDAIQNTISAFKSTSKEIPRSDLLIRLAISGGNMELPPFLFSTFKPEKTAL